MVWRICLSFCSNWGSGVIALTSRKALQIHSANLWEHIHTASWKRLDSSYGLYHPRYHRAQEWGPHCPGTGTSEVLCTTQAGFCAQVWEDLSMALSAALSGMQFSSCLVPMEGNSQRGYNHIVFRVLHRKFTARKWGTRHTAHCSISSKWLELWQQTLGSTHSLT